MTAGSARMDDSWSTTSAGSTKATFAMSARKPCQSGNAYPGCSPPSLNSITADRDRSSRSSSFRTRARWKSPSPPISPETCQSRIPSRSPAAATAVRPGIAGSMSRRRANGAAAIAAPIRRTTASVREAWTRNITPIAPNTSVSPHASVADAPRTPTARATIAPGASTTPVATASRRNRNTELIARSTWARRLPRANVPCPGTSLRARRGRLAPAGPVTHAAAFGPVPPRQLRGA